MVDLSMATHTPTGEEITAMGYTDFDRWQHFQENAVLQMSIVQQAGHYAGDKAWHDRESDEAYRYRNTF